MFIEKVHFMKLRSVQRLLVYRAVTIVCLLTIVTGGIIIGIFVGHVSRAQLNNTPAIAGCSVFPADNIWNRDISNLPAHPNSANFIASIGATGSLVAAFRQDWVIMVHRLVCHILLSQVDSQKFQCDFTIHTKAIPDHIPSHQMRLLRMDRIAAGIDM
jgi:hypothetical protein